MSTDDDLPALPEPTIRVACIKHNGASLIVPRNELGLHVDGLDDGSLDDSATYAITFKTMTMSAYEALGEFDGF